MVQEKIAERTFAEGLVRDVREYLPTEYSGMEFEVTESVKMNGVKRTGIACRMPGQEVSPVIYVGGLLDAVRDGEPMEEIRRSFADMVADAGRECRTVRQNMPALDFDSAREHLSVRLVNTAANREMLYGLPHFKVEDLSAIFTLNFRDGIHKDGVSSAKVTYGMMEKWGIKRRELYHAAMRNVAEKETPVLETLGDVLVGMMTKNGQPCRRNILLEDDPFLPDPESGLILTNRQGIYGASAILRPDVTEKISGLFPEGFYILPSSVHEVIILPKYGQEDMRMLGNMVREVNRAAVSREEFLSDRVYEYDREKKRIRQVPESMKKERAVAR